MKRFYYLFLFLTGMAFHADAQSSLQFFTNRANAALQAQFGFGVTNIPIYSTTNSAISYTAAVHYLLQGAADSYDAFTPAANFASVFRPLFSWESNTLYIVGYAAVTNDFYTQTSTGFKNLSDPTISSNDNVWGVPWVVGAKNPVPSFNEYNYTSRMMVERKVLFERFGNPETYFTNRPPEFTNQFFILVISNLFGVEAWNSYPTTFTNNVTLVVSNQVFMSLTNNHDGGFSSNFTVGTILAISSWPGWLGRGEQENCFVIPILTNTVLLPPSYWSEYYRQFIPFTSSGTNGISSADLHQTGWPVYDWVLNITNNLMYS